MKETDFNEMDPIYTFVFLMQFRDGCDIISIQKGVATCFASYLSK